MTDLEILKGAKKLIADAPRLLKGQYNNGDGKCYCTLGAFEAVWMTDDIRKHKNRALNQRECSSLLGFKCIDIVSWNDNPETTKEDVLDKFDKAIKRLESA